MGAPATAAFGATEIKLQHVGRYPGIRVLAWESDVLYACRRYQILKMQTGAAFGHWKPVAHFSPVWWRRFSAQNRFSYRLVRDGFHALVVLPDGSMVGAVPGAIVTRSSDNDEFVVTHKIQRGTRPLHITAAPTARIYWGEYFDNRAREEVHVYASEDRGRSWQIAHTFPSGSIRHVHNVVLDPWRNCLWILTGDEGRECKIIHASKDLSSIEVVAEGNQQVRAVAAIPTREALYLSTDTPYEQNHILRLDSRGNIERVGALNSSSIYGCQVGDSVFFSTMAEPSTANDASRVTIAGSKTGYDWSTPLHWKKDSLPMRYFQYGNVILPDGNNATRYLAATTVGVTEDDLTTSIWAVS